MSQITITIAVPAAHIADANALASCLGLSEADGQTYGAPVWQDAGGHLYAVASGQVSEGFPAAAVGPLVEPPWGADMEAAARAQALVAIHEPAVSEAPWAAPDRIAAVVGLEAQAALEVLGLSPVPVDLEQAGEE